MRYRRTPQVLLAVFVLMACSALAVRATHSPTVGSLVTRATNNWGMNCGTPTSQVDCTWTNFDTISWLATVKPGSGDARH